MFLELVFAFLASFLIGAFPGWFLFRLYRRRIIQSAEEERAELFREAKDHQELRALEEKELLQEIESELWENAEPHLLETEERIEELESLSEEKKRKADNIYSVARQKTLQYESKVKVGESALQARETSLTKIKVAVEELRNGYIEELSQKIDSPLENIKQTIVSSFIKEAEDRARLYIERRTEATKEHSEDLGKYYIDISLARFGRPYCGERGIAPVHFETPEQRQVLCDKDGNNIKTIEEVTGCDIIVEEDSSLVGVAGFDPVRRELARRLLERILKEKTTVTVHFIKDKTEHIKRELFSLIRKDGDSVTKELGVRGFHQEIRQMLGSLRYRYSFTQNQYFHCAEVGWLCGLLAEEIGTVNVKKARRAGLLHDLGKSMDHELDGGHAVIGANFIEARNEAPDIVHAVRAHHFDEAPSTDLAFLVIAADAISGSRPGARRSTAETYTQKLMELDSIARSFPGVTDCYVLNGGRELRVVVNEKKVDDLDSLKIGQGIANRIESECTYPGQIKIVVVRETLSVETTKTY